MNINKIMNINEIKPAISVWGDSLLKGIIFDEAKGRYITLKNNCVNIVKEKLGLEIKNHALFGCTATKGEEILANSLEKTPNCDLAVIEFGGNDCDYNWAQVSQDPQEEHLPKTTIPKFCKSYQNMINTLRDKAITPILMNLPPISSSKYFSWISKGNNPGNILDFLGKVERIYEHHKSYSQAISQIAKDLCCPLVNVRELFMEYADPDSLLCLDGIHPNQKGQEIMAEAFLSFAEKYRK